MAKGKKRKKRIGGIGRTGGEGWRKERRVSNGTGEMQMGRGKDGKKRRWKEEKLGRWADGQMGRGKDGKKRRWKEEKLGRWADGQMGRGPDGKRGA